tara:strand:- start:217 stop:486 length:270 start_codon:yes stop_codon:yes gene_type:complete
MNNVVEVSETEMVENLGFCLNLVTRGTSIKVIREDGSRVMMVPLPNQEVNPPIGMVPDLPSDPDQFIDPVGTQNYVRETLGELETELNS